jgi:hypothetical protein
MSAFDLERLFVRQAALPPDLLPDRLTNCLDVLDAVVPISRDDALPFDHLDTFTWDDRIISDSGDAVEPVKRTRKRKPTLASVARQAAKAGIPVAGYEVRPDGTIGIVTGKPVDGSA